ncbi:YdcF family protein [Komagataeibacter medellinensis]|uniref:YdcF family protein n=1 Tax=Komagataeibacter medellinensis TaxID=1177712 RepID=A0ABQ6VSN3_9PROT|nr:YdcF family protein [Komagataeibacter medellinensis]KAB8123210.1 YdcF family protein [Komagataeibacter medellinensis]
MTQRRETGLPVVIFGAKLRPDGTPGRTVRLRVAAAHAFGLRQGGVVYVPTGGPSRPSGMTEASVMARLLLDGGAAAGSVLVEDTAPDTLASVIACTRLLRARGYGGVVAVASSAYHLPRCLVLMRMMGWRVQRVPPPKVAAARGWRKRWFWRLREGAALPWDMLLLAIWRLRHGRDGFAP